MGDGQLAQSWAHSRQLIHSFVHSLSTRRSTENRGQKSAALGGGCTEEGRMRPEEVM